MDSDRRQELYNLLKEERSDLEEELLDLELRMSEVQEHLDLIEDQLRFYEKSSTLKTLDQNNNKSEYIYSIKLSSSRPDINKINILGDQVLAIMKHYLRRTSPIHLIEEKRKELTGDEKELKFSIRNKIKHGELLQVRFNNSRKFTFPVLPEWVIGNELKDDYYPLEKYQPKSVTSVDIVKIDEND